MHALSIVSDVFAEEGARGGLLEGAMKAIADEGAGVIVVINRPMPDALAQSLQDPRRRRLGRRTASNCAIMASAPRSSPSSASTT